jgi:hypothetical protein
VSKLYYAWGLSLSLTVAGLGCASTQPDAISNAQSMMAGGKYEMALRQLNEGENLATLTPAVRAQRAYLKGVCYQKSGSLMKANAMFRFTADHFPNTQYGALAQAELNIGDSYLAATGAEAFRRYDRELEQSITDHWHQLLESNTKNPHPNGKVVVQFKLYSDGEILDQQILVDTTGNSMAALICINAIKASAPFGEWTPEMIQSQGNTSRSMTFTFHYNEM